MTPHTDTIPIDPDRVPFRKLDMSTAYKIAGVVELTNELTDDSALTTGDCDGMAVVLRARC